MLASKNALLVLFATANVVTAQTLAPVTMAPVVIPTPDTSAPVTADPVAIPTDAPNTGMPVIAPTDDGPMATTSAPVTVAPVTTPMDSPIAPVSAPVASTPAPIAPVTEDPTTPSATPSSLPSGSILPAELQPRADFRCGKSELDARGNCNKVCNDDVYSCDEGEFCLQTFPNYCHVQPEGHPDCEDLDMGEASIRRCGFEEDDARAYCGKACTSSAECGDAEFCFPVQRNFCNFFEIEDEEAGGSRLRRMQEADKTNAQYFAEAKEVINPYFLKAAVSDPPASSPTSQAGSSEPTSSSSTISSSFMVGALYAVSMFIL